jgi:hypothetical protein
LVHKIAVKGDRLAHVAKERIQLSRRMDLRWFEGVNQAGNRYNDKSSQAGCDGPSREGVSFGRGVHGPCPIRVPWRRSDSM